MDKQGNATPTNAIPTNARQPKRDPTQPEPDSLEDLNVTAPAPIDQPAGREQRNATRPAPPK